MRNWILGALASTLVATCALAQRGERMSADCRAEIVRLCGMDRDAIRSCLKEKAAALSDDCRAEIRKQVKRRGADRLSEPSASGATELAYGQDRLQKLDFWQPKNTNAPLIVLVHGGGWKRGDKNNATGETKPAHFVASGYAFASINYRLVPAATVEQQASDVAAAVAYLKNNAQRLKVDPDRIVLMGHSAGAHLVALVGTDPSFMRNAGLDVSALAGVIPLDGAAYDVPVQISDGARLMRDTYLEAFGTDPDRQKALSPYWHAAAPNAPAFLILHVERDDGARQSAKFAEALQQAGTNATLQGFGGKGLRGHMEINRNLGDPAYPATPVVDAWLRQLFGS